MEPNPRNDIRLTTKSLGIADSKEEDLGGYVLSQKDIVNATTKILLAVGIKANDIRTIKVGSDENKNLKIICEISYKAAFSKSSKNDNTGWYSFTDGDSNENDDDFKGAFNKNFYAALYNKVYHGKKKHLGMRIVRRPDPNGGKTRKYVRIEFNPYILIAFVYDIVFTDPFYKISAPPVRWLPSKKIHDMAKKDREKYLAKKNEYDSEKIANCSIFVTFSKNSKYVLHQQDGKETVITGFHPAQVDDFFGDDDD